MFAAFYPGQSYPAEGPSTGFLAAWMLDEWCVGRGMRMLINTAGQRVGMQMVSAADGSAFTGAVTVSVTIDAGTQATGSVGSGACTHEGNGYHTYAPAQAETNGALLAFTFTGVGAIPRTLQVYTVAGDAFTRLGAPAGASVSADVAAIQAKTVNLPTDPADASDVAAGLAALNDVSAAEVNAEVVDALATDTYAEVTGVPGFTVPLSTMIRRLYTALINPIDITSTKKTFKSAAGVAQWDKDLSDDGSTYSETEGGAP